MIGVFDSGLGGLTVLKEIKRLMPEYNYIYYGDTLHLPYGNRSDASVFDLTKKACEFLFGQGCSLIIIACNTATAKALRKLQQDYLDKRRQDIRDKPFDPSMRLRTGATQGRQDRQNVENILGVVRPVAEYFAKNGGERVGVIGTRGTIASNIYVEELKALHGEIQVFQQATPLLVPLIEENWAKESETEMILRKYLSVLKLNKVDSLILGCTHYPLILKSIRKIMGKKCLVPNPAEIVAESLKDYLARHPEIESILEKNGKRKYFVTDLTENFVDLARKFLDEKILIERIDC